MMSWVKKLPEWGKRTAAVVTILGAISMAIVWLPTPLQTDAEAGEYRASEAENRACQEIVDLFWRIQDAEADLANQSIDDWYKADLKKKLPRWRQLLTVKLQQYPRCANLIPTR